MNRSLSIHLGSYQVHERLGEGGGGQVYRADGPDGPVAIKVLAPAAELDPAARARFAREAKALAALRHPGLVALLDHGVDDELGPYLVQPLIDGVTLRAAFAGRRLGPEAARLLAAPLAEAVATMHAAGFVHRDVKPDNAMIGADGRVTLLDLGLAWRADMTRHTETGAAVGTIGYMAPEQIEGGAVTPAVDVWALGVMLHEWIAGARPFARARPGEEAVATLVGGAARLDAIDGRVDDELAALVARCLSTTARARPTARELADALLAPLAAADLDGARERAALVADPDGYPARVAPTQARRHAARAEAALAAGEPFAALAACDRGLAYVADDAALLALVARAEAAPAPATTVAVAAAPTARTPTRARRRWLWLGGAGLAAVAIAAAVLLGDGPAAPAASPPPTASTSTPTSPELAVVSDMIGLFKRAMDAPPASPPSTPTRASGPPPTTATGWLARARTEEPAEALRSVRKALALAPTWGAAHREACRALLALDDADAIGACAEAARLAPSDPVAIGLAGVARGRAGDLDGGVAALTWAIARDGDPRWRAERAALHARRGDATAAAADRRDACALGVTEACASVTAPAP